MKAQTLVPALALAAALLSPPLVEAGHRHGPGCGHRPPAHGYSRHRPAPHYSYGYRPYYRPRHHAQPPHYGYGAPYYGYAPAYGYGYGYGYYPPPPPVPYCPPRPRVGVWFGF